MQEHDAAYTPLASNPWSPRSKVRAPCTRLQGTLVAVIVLDFLTSLACVSELSWSHFVFVFSNFLSEYNIAWGDIDMFVLSMARTILYFFVLFPIHVWELVSSGLCSVGPKASSPRQAHWVETFAPKHGNDDSLFCVCLYLHNGKVHLPSCCPTPER